MAGNNSHTKRRKPAHGKMEFPEVQTDSVRSLEGTIFDHSLEVYEQALESAFEKRRDFFVHAFATRLREIQHKEQPSARKEQNAEWVEIESLSKLRGIVGGRFQNIKTKWTTAGLPLKEHRGDKIEPYELNKPGWIELTNWILSQGFEARLPSDGESCLFEIRPVRNDV